ncbi:MAG TPA: rhamnulokinase family protein [Planctomycetota bacterium]|nr:rhamnulokinase family protein [Planctomycetota bacterium]
MILPHKDAMQMTAETQVLAIDIGASSGKALLGWLDSGLIRLEEVYRFSNGTAEQSEHLVWDLDVLLQNVRACIAAARTRRFLPRALAIDTWGVDYGLIDAQGKLIKPVYAYRDAQHQRGMDTLHKSLPFNEIYAITGIQRMPFNTIYQLAARSQQKDSALAAAATLAMIPELLTGLLCGKFVAEETNASTSALMDAQTRQWSPTLCRAAGFPLEKMPKIVPAGTCVASGAEISGMPLDIHVPACHDTAAAVAATPLTSANSVYISSGTWSLVGMETKTPQLTEAARKFNFTNEAGILGTTRLLTNVMGLWLLQEARRQWASQGQALSFDQIAEAAAQHTGPVPILNPDDARFLAPKNMLDAIADYCRATQQTPPPSVGATAQCIEFSLALRYAQAIDQLKALTGITPDAIHIVGGGCQDKRLCQTTADVTGLPVIAGPVECTALGNAVVQWLARKQIASHAEARRMVAASFPTTTFHPHPSEAWAPRRKLFERLTH